MAAVFITVWERLYFVTTDAELKRAVFLFGVLYTRASPATHDQICKTNIMMTSSNGTIFRVTGPLCEEFTGEFPSQRPVTQRFDIFCVCAWINCWVNNREAGDLRRRRPHYDVAVMLFCASFTPMSEQDLSQREKTLQMKPPLSMAKTLMENWLWIDHRFFFVGATLDAITAVIASFNMAATRSGESTRHIEYSKH